MNLKVFLVLMVGYSTTLQANESVSNMDELFAMDLSTLLTVQIATGTSIEVNKAPAVASVITAEQIKQMGARNLSEVLNTVPGLHVTHTASGIGPSFGFRAITSQFTPHTLVMVNGGSIKSVVRGDSHAVWGEFPIHAIARVEIIRGPGSALYGADAFSGVINVITKKYADIEHSEAGASVGSFDSKSVWANHSASWSDWQLALNVEYTESDVYKGLIESDAQTVFDNRGDALFAAGILPSNPDNASLAPGYLSTGFKALDIWLNAENSYFNMNLGVQDRNNVGLGRGTIQALDPHGRLGSYKYLFQSQLKPQKVADNLNIEAELSVNYSGQTVEEYLHLLPAGAFFGAFKQPLIGNPEWDESHQKFEVKTSYTGWYNHNIILGMGYSNQDLYEVRESKNFNPDFSPKVEGVVDVSDTSEVFIPEFKRENNYLFVQDIFQIHKDWVLTAGLRYDDYTDFGSTVNPRMALVWSATSKLTAKVLYGRAFRAPAFIETIIVNNPLALGNPNLSPEIIDSYEMAFSYSPNRSMDIDLNFFRYEIDDFINFVADVGSTTSTAQNSGARSGYGLESVIRFAVTDTWLINANYAYVKAKDKQTNHSVGEYPNHTAYIRSNWQFDTQWKLHTQVYYVGERKRVWGDIRPALKADYSIDLSVTYTLSRFDAEVEVLVDNLLDRNIRTPSIGTTDFGVTPVNIPNDVPYAGRNMYLRLTKQF